MRFNQRRQRREAERETLREEEASSRLEWEQQEDREKAERVAALLDTSPETLMVMAVEEVVEGERVSYSEGLAAARFAKAAALAGIAVAIQVIRGGEATEAPAGQPDPQEPMAD